MKRYIRCEDNHKNNNDYNTLYKLLLDDVRQFGVHVGLRTANVIGGVNEDGYLFEGLEVPTAIKFLNSIPEDEWYYDGANTIFYGLKYRKIDNGQNTGYLRYSFKNDADAIQDLFDAEGKQVPKYYHLGQWW